MPLETAWDGCLTGARAILPDCQTVFFLCSGLTASCPAVLGALATMMLGRLELFSLQVMLLPVFWKKAAGGRI